MGKKAQGALEFLMTYGWAFLVILIMIGALAYFGVLNPTKFLPERCNFGQEIKCQDFMINRTGDAVTAQISLVNTKGNTIQLILGGESTCTADGWNSNGNVVNASGSTGNITWDAKQKIRLICTNPNGIPFASKGNKGKVLFSLKYKDVGGDFFHKVDGEVFAKVQ